VDPKRVSLCHIKYMCHTCNAYGTLNFTVPDALKFFPQKVLSEILESFPSG